MFFFVYFFFGVFVGVKEPKVDVDDNIDNLLFLLDVAVDGVVVSWSDLVRGRPAGDFFLMILSILFIPSFLGLH